MEEKGSGEKTFLNENDVTVTNARFVVLQQTFAMRNITSVKFLEQKPNRLGPLLLLAFGLTLLSQEPARALGIFIIIAAIIGWYSQKSIFEVVLTTASGEAKVLKTTDGNFVKKVVAALNDSIIHRG